MLCESRLWSMTYELEDVDLPPPEKAHQSATSGLQRAAVARMPVSTGHSPPEQTGSKEYRPSKRSASTQSCIPPLQALDHQGALPGRQIAPEIEIPVQAHSGGDVPFLVPSFCQSICQNYSDLHIGGDQVLPLSTNDGELRVCAETQAIGPFLQSCDVPPAVEGSPPEQTSQCGPSCPSRVGATHWRLGSGQDPSLLFQGCEGPCSNSLLNRYLEHKVLDLYQQYMMENMAWEGGSGSGPTCPLLVSELVLTSVDQITLQLSWDGNLEAGQAKDMVLSCLLRVAGDMQSSEISTPFLQISNEASVNQPTDDAEE